MAKRSRPNFSGKERASKLRRMGKVDRAQQEEIDALQELLQPELKWRDNVSTPNQTPWVNATAGSANGALFLTGWDQIVPGTGYAGRVGNIIQLSRCDLSFQVRWSSHVSISGELERINFERIRIDYLLLKGDVTLASLVPRDTKEAVLLSSAAGGKAYVLNQGFTKGNSNVTATNYWKDNVRHVKSRFIRNPLAVESGARMSSGYEIPEVTQASHIINFDANSTVPAIATASQAAIASTQNRDVVSTNKLYSFRWRMNRKIEWEHGSTTTVLPQTWVPAIMFTYWGEASDATATAGGHILDNTDANAAKIIALNQQWHWTDL